MHGKAPYKHDSQLKDSYFVTLSTPTGEKTVWGVDLKHAMEEGNKGVGDLIRLEFLGSRPVTLQVEDRDANDNLLGLKEKTFNRNTWAACDWVGPGQLAANEGHQSDASGWHHPAPTHMNLSFMQSVMLGFRGLGQLGRAMAVGGTQVSESINGYGVERIHRELHQLMDNVHAELEALETTQRSTFVDPAAGAALQAAQLDAFTPSDAGRAQVEILKYRFDQINQLSIQLIDKLGNSDSNIAEVEDVVINPIKRLAERHKEVLRALGEPDHSLLDRLQDVAQRLMEKIKALFDKLGTVILGAPDNAAPGSRPGN